MDTFRKFLLKNSVELSAEMPLTHTTASLRLKSIKESNTLIPQRCDVFKNEDLTYFFVGRPAYKLKDSGGEATYWQLPCVFVFSYDLVKSPKRVYPFDSGAFTRGLMPSYINMIERDNFECSSVADASRRIIGAYFRDVRSYFKGKENPDFERKFMPGVFEEEVQALHELAKDKRNASVDDRRLTIELQTSNTIDLTVSTPLAVIVPEKYLESREFMEHVEKKWKAQLITYDMQTLSISNYVAQIYDRLAIFYEKLGVL